MLYLRVSEPSAGLGSKTAIPDLIVAASICLAAVVYWTWDFRPRMQQADRAEARSPANGNRLIDQLNNEKLNNDKLNNDEGTRLYLAADYRGAEARFRLAIAANPAGALGYCNLGAALIAERRFDEAIAALNQAIVLDPGLTLARNNLNWALQEKAKLGK